MRGVEQAVRTNAALARGVNTWDGAARIPPWPLRLASPSRRIDGRGLALKTTATGATLMVH